MNHAEALTILKKARSLIKSYQETYICCAISEAHSQMNGDYLTNHPLHERVLSVLEGQITFGCWLQSKTGDFPTYEEARTARLAWMDQWIAAIEKEMKA